jgi:hypothetical protein
LFGVDTLTDVFVTWNTASDTEASIVVYWDNGFIMTANGTSTLFVNGGNEKRKQYIHRVKLPNLTPARKYSKLAYLTFTIVKLSSPTKDLAFSFAVYEERNIYLYIIVLYILLKKFVHKRNDIEKK